MSTTPIVAAILAALADGPMTTDALIEETGFERPAIVQTLAQLKHERQAYPGRGGWRAGEPAAPRVHTHEASAPTPEPAPKQKRPREAPAAMAPEKRTSPRVKGTRRATKPTKPTKARAVKRFPRSAPRAAQDAQPVEVFIPLRRGAKYVFGVTERGELTITDYKDSAKTFALNALDTAGLARCLERWAPMLAKIREAA